MRTAPAIKLSDDDRRILERRSRGRSTEARLVLRSKIALLAASGLLNREIARELRCSSKTVCLWRRRFAERGIAGIEKDAPRGGKRAQETDRLMRQILEKTLHESPPRRRRWSTRSLAAAVGTSPAMVWRVWKAHGLTGRPASAGASTRLDREKE
jgi:transposase